MQSFHATLQRYHDPGQTQTLEEGCRVQIVHPQPTQDPKHLKGKKGMKQSIMLELVTKMVTVLSGAR